MGPPGRKIPVVGEQHRNKSCLDQLRLEIESGTLALCAMQCYQMPHIEETRVLVQLPFLSDPASLLRCRFKGMGQVIESITSECGHAQRQETVRCQEAIFASGQVEVETEPARK